MAGDCNKQLLAALEKTPKAQAVMLHLNDVPMVGMPPRSIDDAPNDSSILNFPLERDPRDTAERESWDHFLRVQKGADFPMAAALSIGNDRAVALSPTSMTFGVSSASAVGWAIGFALVAFFASILVLQHLRSAMRDDDGRFSLGKSQLVFWGLLLFIAEGAMVILTGTLEPIPDSILTLAGISAATGLFAVGIETSKTATRLNQLTAEQTLLASAQTNDPPLFAKKGGEQRLEQIKAEITELARRPLKRSKLRNLVRDVCDGGNGLAFHRLQAFLWTLLLGGFFCWSVIKTMSMPNFDTSLLLLMGISSGTYLGFKLPESQKNETAETIAAETGKATTPRTR